ncbi:hypothetical protein [Marasmitruncus massiliensis]|uniref:hypothetical protein n=1 Tax=Marasmitruncus massiliensis TaxID=1944642 RepID=UPI000C7CE7D2|nr:hypothetical protein [Marasmitruncus massiliensis]
MKKLIASLLTVATVASMASMSAFAADAKDYTATAAFGTNVYTDTDVELDTNTVKPDKTVYININALTFSDGATAPATILGSALKGYLTDDDYFKIKTDKGDDDTKMIKKISVTEKDIEDDTDGREVVVKIELNDDTTDKEFKINPSVTFTAKDDIAGVATGDKLTVELGKLYITNTELKGDNDWDAGEGGFIAKPLKNEDNEITWEDENDTIARLTFEGDSDVNKYYPKLSTKWDNADYAENFAGTDAFIRSFVGNPTISATSRPVLELYNPFIDEDGEETVAAEDVVIYEVVDGALVDVTEKFTAGENDDGDSVFTIKTRTLGTYIFSNGAATTPEEEPAVEEPTDVKENPGTGRF